MAVRIVTDSSSDLTDDEVASHDIEVVPLSIRFGDQEFEDRTQLTVEAFYEKLAASPVLPETAAPAPGKFEAAFRRQQAASNLPGAGAPGDGRTGTRQVRGRLPAPAGGRGRRRRLHQPVR